MNVRDKELAVKCRLLTKHTGGIYTDSLQEFADLIRADAMEAATRAANESWSLACKKMVEFEREACAKVCDFEWGTGAEKDAGMMFAAAIRARSEGQK
jgi:hypothetical protein